MTESKDNITGGGLMWRIVLWEVGVAILIVGYTAIILLADWPPWANTLTAIALFLLIVLPTPIIFKK